MKYILETFSGKRGIKKFETLDEYVDYMTRYGDKIKSITEAELPYEEQPVKLSTTTPSDGWGEVESSVINTLTKDEGKGDSLLSKGSESVLKDGAKFEPATSNSKGEEPTSDVKSYSNASTPSEPKDWKDFKYEDSDKASKKAEEEKPAEKAEDKSSDEKSSEDFKKKLEEGLFGGLKGEELDNYVNEYLVYTFMDIFGKVSYENNQSYQQIVKKLVQTDPKMKAFVEKIRSWISYQTALDRPINVYKKLQQYLVKNGVDKAIVEKAAQTFENEELNTNESLSEDIEKQIAEALECAGVNTDETVKESTCSEDIVDEAIDTSDDLSDGDDFEETRKCNWCGEEFPKNEMKHEHYFGWVCDHCARYLDSREDCEWDDPKDVVDEDDVEESACSEDVGSETDMELDPKTGKAKLFEEEPEIEEGCK
jgi:hypothetical protein